jgi:predicted DNA-binding transcriptional regulator YafY
MNRTDRLLAIVLELQARSQRRAEDLAATFETSKRTIYRDIQALSEAGVPIVSVPGQGYSLVEGYFLPPLRFSTEEAMMLLLGSDAVAQHFDPHYRAAALSASRKIEAVLPVSLRADVRNLQQSIRFVEAREVEDPTQAILLQQLRRALLERRAVRFTYHARLSADDKRATRTREADPYGLAHVHDAWYLVAHDHLRHALRSFRLNRMENLTILDRHFQRPSDFSLERKRDDESRTLTIRALFDSSIARWVRESRFYYVVAEGETPEGLLVTLQVRDLREALPWLLSWGAKVKVLEPPAVREQLANEAQAILQNTARC